MPSSLHKRQRVVTPPAFEDNRPTPALSFLLYLPTLQLQRRAMERTFFVLRYVRGEESGDCEMTTRSQYLNKANDCADAAKKARDPAERVALLQVSQCF